MPVTSFKKIHTGGKHYTKREKAARDEAQKKVTANKRPRLKVPEWLSPAARIVWQDTLKAICQYDVLDRVDTDVFAQYCDMVVKIETINAQIGDDYTIENAKGETVLNPLVHVEQRYKNLLLQYADKLGISAAGRARLAGKIAAETQKDGLDITITVVDQDGD